jgi:hypothetical protein
MNDLVHALSIACGMVGVVALLIAVGCGVQLAIEKLLGD